MVQYACPSCNEILNIPRQYVGKRGQCRACGGMFVVPSVDATAAALASFESSFAETNDAAFAIVVELAIPALPVTDEGRISQNYSQIAKGWRCDDLVEASGSGLKAIVAKNLRVMAARTDFEEFEIVIDAEDVPALLVMAKCSATSRPVALRIWRTRDRFFICGGADFVTPRIGKRDGLRFPIRPPNPSQSPTLSPTKSLAKGATPENG